VLRERVEKVRMTCRQLRRQLEHRAGNTISQHSK
jgi:hypothetical protein